MNRTVRQHDARTNITYVYEVIEAHYDPEKKQARSTRRLVGKLDENGNVIPTGPKGRPKGSTTRANEDAAVARATQRYKDLLEQKENALRKKEKELDSLSNKLKEAEKTLLRYQSAVRSTEKIWAELK